MPTPRLYLQKNDLSENEKRPYFTLKAIIDGGENVEAEFREIGAFWKAKSGNGYTGTLSEGAVLNIDDVKGYGPKKEKAPAPESAD